MEISSKDLLNRLKSSGVVKSYTIAFSLRCDSTVFSNVLVSLGCARPTEYFQYPYESNLFFMDYRGLSEIDQLCKLISSHMNAGIFGSKMTHDHRAHLDGILSHHIMDYHSLDDVLPDHKWVFMQRNNVIDQAISLHVAESSKQWHVSSNDQYFEHKSVPYNFFSILSKVMILSTANVNWDAYFSNFNIQPHRISYEQLILDPDTVLQRAFDFLGYNGIVSAVKLESEGGLVHIAERLKPIYDSLKDRFLEDFIKIGQADDHKRLGPCLDQWNQFFSESQWRV